MLDTVPQSSLLQHQTNRHIATNAVSHMAKTGHYVRHGATIVSKAYIQNIRHPTPVSHTAKISQPVRHGATTVSNTHTFRILDTLRYPPSLTRPR